MSVRLTNKQSIPKVIKEMTLEEKVSLIIGDAPFRTRSIERFGIPSVLLLDGGTGMNFMQLHQQMFYKYDKEFNNIDDSLNVSGMEVFGLSGRFITARNKPEILSKEDQEIFKAALSELEAVKPEGKSPGCFPPGMMLGATWDPETAYECATALGKEADAFKVDVLLGTPNVNIHRDPLNGRLFEGYSEDPCLVAKLAPSFVKGIQEQGVTANVKHFAANNQEAERMEINEHIPVRALHEIYFPGFKACVQKGEVKTVMSAYNKINGESCAMNKWLLTEVLRNRWNFAGFVVSDWGAAYDQVIAAEAGNDLIMPGPRNLKPLIDAVKSGKIKESVIDNCVENFLKILIEMPVFKGRKYNDIDTDFSKNAAYKAAAEGIVLLKNKGNTLPLDKSSKICFYGQKSKKFIESGGGSAEVWTDLSSNVFASTIEKVGVEAVSFETINPDTDVVVITAGAKGQEGTDRKHMDLDASDREMLFNAVKQAKAAGKKTVVILNICGPVEMNDWIDDVDAVLCVFFPGMEGGHAAADIIFGDLNPSGKLPLTFPKQYRDCPTYGNFPGELGEVWYGEGIYVGYRYYDFKGIEPLYPFGYGLSYTDFEFKSMRLESENVNLDKGEKVNINITVKNIGRMAGKEVIQLYVSDEESTLKKPPKELKSFKKMYLEPGEEKEVLIQLDKDDLASFDIRLDRWTVEPGYYTILAGNSSRNIYLSKRVRVQCENPYAYGPDSTIEKVFNDKRAVDIIKRHLKGPADPMDIIANDLIFNPDTKLKDVWMQRFGIFFLGKNEDKQNLIIEKIYNEIKLIDI